jgi:hypothetical protein
MQLLLRHHHLFVKNVALLCAMNVALLCGWNDFRLCDVCVALQTVVYLYTLNETRLY